MDGANLAKDPVLPGTLLTDGKHYLSVATSDGWLNLLQLQLPSKRRLPIEELLRGFHPDASWRME